MPLKTKRTSPRVKTGKCGSKRVAVTSLKKTVSKSGSKGLGKLTTSGDKSGKRPERTKAGYELYSSDSDDHPSQDKKCQYPEVPALVKTLVQEWMAKQGDAESENLVRPADNHSMYGRGNFNNTSDRAPFNKRLVSSTPDPELLDEQAIPELDSGHHEASQLVAGVQSGKVQGLLTETERELLRQQIDAVLLEEGVEAHRQLQQNRPQKTQVPQATGTALPQDHQPRAGRDAYHHQAAAAAPLPKQRTVQPRDFGVPQERQAGPMSAAQSTWCDIMAKSGLPGRSSDIGVFHHFLHRESSHGLPLPFMHGGAGDGDCQMFLPQNGAGVVPNMSMGFTPVGDHTAAFNPFQSDAAGNSQKGMSPSSGFKPLEVMTENEVLDQEDRVMQHRVQPSDQVHSATPACSLLWQQNQGATGASQTLQTGRGSVQNVHKLRGKTLLSDRTNKSSQKFASHELQTPATSPEEATSQSGQRGPLTSARQNAQQKQQTAQKSGSRPIRGRASHSTSNENQNAQNSSSHGKEPKNSGKGVSNEKKSVKAPLQKAKDSYTSDGYYINRVDENDGADDEPPPEPRAFLPTPMQSPKMPSTHMQDSLDSPAFGSEQGQLNKNNSSDCYPGQNEADHSWMHAHRRAAAQTPSPRASSSFPLPDFLNQVRPAREAMADAEFTSLPLGVVRAMMMEEDHDNMEGVPATPAPSPMPAAFHNRETLNGPRRLRHLLNELKEICAIDGDMEVDQFVQEIIDLVESMPQLKVTFNLQAETDLAMQPLRNENSQLRRRLRILNQQLKERERREKEDTNPGMNFEMLHLQTENASLQRQLKEEREGCKKLSQYIMEQQQQLERASKELQLIQCKLTDKDHEKLLARQEYTQDLTRLHQEVEMMSRRNESVQLQLASADRENNILQLNLKQRDMEINRLHVVLGNLKQGVAEVLQYFDQSVGDLNTTDSAIQKLLGFLKSSSQAYNPPKDDLLSRSSDLEPIERSGNHRSKRPHCPDKENTQDTVSGEKNDSKHGSASSLTVAALAAHNRQLEAVKNRTENFDQREDFSFHSWDGAEHQRSFIVNKSHLYHSDPESVASPIRKAGHHRHHHYQAKQDQLLAKEPLDLNQSHHLSPRTADMDGVNINDNKAASQLEVESLFALSERPISEADKDKADTTSDTKVYVSRHSMTDYFKKYPGSKPTNVRPKSPPRLSCSGLADESASHAFAQETKAREKSPHISSPNSSLTLSTTDTVQKDYFQGTELDLSLSTIQEDALTSVSGTTLTSFATAMSLDDRAFREGIATLDDNIAKVHEALLRTKKMFS